MTDPFDGASFEQDLALNDAVIEREFHEHQQYLYEYHMIVMKMWQQR